MCPGRCWINSLPRFSTNELISSWCREECGAYPFLLSPPTLLHSRFTLTHRPRLRRYVVRTGLFIEDISITKKAFRWPLQVRRWKA